MSTDEEKRQFYEQFNTVKPNHQAWCNTPEGTLEVLKHPWKAQPPIVYIDIPGETSTASILRRLKEKHGVRK